MRCICIITVIISVVSSWFLPKSFAQEQELINNRLSLIGTKTSFNPTPVDGGAWGTFTITATFKNASKDNLTKLAFQVIQLTGGNLLLNADGHAGGIGSTLTVPFTGNYFDGALSPEENFKVDFIIGLASPSKFTFHVDALGTVVRVGGMPDPVDVTAITGQKIAGPVTSWQTPDGRYTVEHLAGQSQNGDLLVFYWSPRADWQFVNVTEKTGQKIVGPVTSWQTRDGRYTVEHLAGQSQNGDLLVFYWSPRADWQFVNVTSHVADGKVANGVPTVYQLADGNENVELLGTRSPSGSLLLYWWKPSRDWQAVNLSEITGRTISADPASWLTTDGDSVVEHFAAPDQNGHLLVFWGYSKPRLLTDGLGNPFQSLKRVRTPRNIIAILWDWDSDPRLDRSVIEDALFGVTNSVRDYFLENSNGYFTIENAGVFGWYDADKPFDHYANENEKNDPIDKDKDGWLNGHAEKWAEAIRKADVDFDFAAYDSNGDKVLSPDELGISIIIPQDNPFGTVNGVVGREYPTKEPLIVDGVQVNVMAEFYIGNPPNIGLVAHELSHLLLGAKDMYFGYCLKHRDDDPEKECLNVFDNPSAAGGYSLMDQHIEAPHLDPFHKLKLGWVRPKIIFRDGQYRLPNVEEHHDVWVLLNPTHGAKEYFIVENRWRGNSYDREIDDNGGLAVWHIMEDPAVYGTVPPPPGVEQEDWDTLPPDAWSRRAIRMIRPMTAFFDNSQALWDGAQPGTDYDLLSEDPDPSHAKLRWADGTPSGFNLRSISAAGLEMQATIDVPSP
ncbi:MAG: hypothetical protein JETT_1737 [Candidatus Jettenia ecosi]|uniref:EF-hand domain-containing protein n=1 Tax=Candidatus Jettenia ecosi TaxID=2494326 RepID=A0A533QBD9_9BACT|nr:MAG: hypothetical protein JETT_1737 [Candidatus Jettenia ecosi]